MGIIGCLHICDLTSQLVTFHCFASTTQSRQESHIALKPLYVFLLLLSRIARVWGGALGL
ncbi:uncharacterized protein MELLADRAFT_84552 [Melampsora larici-populina 98AG31]|uniref:Uncharacterized protein n=1 Tax=Melampsora larici-populina (strain 98AG31 / pathotype 3-4-7) TaxID=747676 RepID=F4SCF5_MELLP|nr:uncharacterized protein MELLADRAFT_84552 [Melampsora larici-populina 98AG31]EGF97673.1 hypothetical protein MELLADRAFT_84552 [Melampsora larici-populina 98AG31]